MKLITKKSKIKAGRWLVTVTAGETTVEIEVWRDRSVSAGYFGAWKSGYTAGAVAYTDSLKRAVGQVEFFAKKRERARMEREIGQK